MQKFNWILASIILFNILSCNKKSTEKTDDTKEVPVLTIQKKDTIVSAEYVAEVQAKKNIEIHTRISGILQHVAVHEGQFVQQGQLLFKINDAELQIDVLKANAGVKQAEADVSIAKVELNQAQSLYSKSFVAKNELDMAKAKMSAAQAKLSYADAERRAALQKISFTNKAVPIIVSNACLWSK